MSSTPGMLFLVILLNKELDLLLHKLKGKRCSHLDEAGRIAITINIWTKKGMSESFLGVKHTPFLRKSHKRFKVTGAVRKFHNHTQQTQCWTFWKLFSVNGVLRNRESAKCWQIMLPTWLQPFKDLKSSLLDVEDEIDNELTNAGVLADSGPSSSSFQSPTTSDSEESKSGDEDDLLQNGSLIHFHQSRC